MLKFSVDSSDLRLGSFICYAGGEVVLVDWLSAVVVSGHIEIGDCFFVLLALLILVALD